MKLLKIAVVAVLLVGIIIAAVIALNPFRTLPSITVESASIELTPAGYVLVLTVSATGRAQLIGVEVEGETTRVAYDIHPPRTTLQIPLRRARPGVEVVLYFNVGSPVKVKPVHTPHPPVLEFVPGVSRIFATGVLPTSAVAVFTRATREFRAAIIVDTGWVLTVRQNLRKYIPGFNIPVYDVYNVVDVLDEVDVVVFEGIYPEPELLDELVRAGKVVVLSGGEPPGSQRFTVRGGKVETYVVDKKHPEADYFGMPCVVRATEEEVVTNSTHLRVLMKLYGKPFVDYAISRMAKPAVVEVSYAESKAGDVYLAKTKRGFYISMLDTVYTALLVMSGFFIAAGEPVVVELTPFSGVRPLNVPVLDYWVLYAISGEAVKGFYMKHQVVIATKVSNNIRLTFNETDYSTRIVRAFLNGSVEEVVLESSRAPPAIDLPLVPDRVYVVYLNGTPSLVIADEEALSRRDVDIENSEICEAFYIRVRVEDKIDSPLYLYVNGRYVATLGPGGEHFVTGCEPGYYHVELRNVYGEVVSSKVFEVKRFYEQPMFYLGVLLLGSVGATAVTAVTRRGRKEPTTVSVVLYSMPERPVALVDEAGVLEELSKVASIRETVTLTDLVKRIYDRKPAVKTIADAFASLARLASSGKLHVVSRYVPDLGDTVSAMGTTLEEAHYAFYTAVVREVLTRLGGATVRRDLYRDIVSVDDVAILGSNMVLVTYALTGVRRPEEAVKSAVDRALSAYMLVKNLKMPYTPVGFIIVTEPEYVRVVNSILDDILSGNEEVASKILSDMTIFRRIMEKSKEMRLRRMIALAAPVTHLTIAFAAVKVAGKMPGAVSFANKYYRLARFG